MAALAGRDLAEMPRAQARHLIQNQIGHVKRGLAAPQRFNELGVRRDAGELGHAQSGNLPRRGRLCVLLVGDTGRAMALGVALPSLAIRWRCRGPQ